MKKGLLELKRALRPLVCNEKIRVGSKFDGGYILPKKAITDADALVSFGISTNFDFEREIKNLNDDIKIYMFDPFIGFFEDLKRLIKRVTSKTKPTGPNIILPENPVYASIKSSLTKDVFSRLLHWVDFFRFKNRPNVSFKKIGIRDYTDKMFIDFDALFSLTEINKLNDIILKIDIEGDEYKVYKQLLPYMNKTNVLLIELHDVKDNFQNVLDMVNCFKGENFYLVHIHGNNTDVVVNDTTIPNTLELTFCNDKYCDRELFDTTSYPNETLDNPCNPKWLDHGLEFLKENLEY